MILKIKIINNSFIKMRKCIKIDIIKNVLWKN